MTLTSIIEKNWLIPLVLSLMFSCLISCSDRNNSATPSGTGSGDHTLQVYASFYPVQYFTERIGGEQVSVTCPVPDDRDPAHWMPEKDTILDMQDADLIVLNGAQFEAWPRKVSLPQDKLVRTAEGIPENKWIHRENEITHSHGPEGKHSHEAIDGHFWMDPLFAIKQARRILRALKDRKPDQAEKFEGRFRELKADLEQLHKTFKNMIEEYSGPTILASHPTYNYWARRYQLDQQLVNLELEPGTALTDHQVNRIRELRQAAEEPPKYVLWETKPKSSVKQQLRDAFDLKGVVFSPAELRSERQRKEGMDYLAIMRRNAERLRAIFSK